MEHRIFMIYKNKFIEGCTEKVNRTFLIIDAIMNIF
jgi:hypothetical protein